MVYLADVCMIVTGCFIILDGKSDLEFEIAGFEHDFKIGNLLSNRSGSSVVEFLLWEK